MSVFATVQDALHVNSSNIASIEFLRRGKESRPFFLILFLFVSSSMAAPDNGETPEYMSDLDL